MFCFFFFFRQSRLNEISNNICSCCPGKFGFDTCLGSCSIVGSKGPKTTLFLIGFITPCLAIVICYAGIFWTVNKWADILSCSGHHLSPKPIDGGRFFFFFFFFSRSRTRVQGHAGTTAAAPGRTGSDWRLTKMILIIFVSFIVCYLPTAIIKIVDKEVKRAGKWSHFRLNKLPWSI